MAPTARYQISVLLRDGHKLAARDKNGFSDPYVRFKHERPMSAKDGKEPDVYKSAVVKKNLNPVWNEHFTAWWADLSVPLLIEVWDRDVIGHDDFMGRAVIALRDCELGVTQVLSVPLEDPLVKEDLGNLRIDLTIHDMETNIIPQSPATLREHCRTFGEARRRLGDSEMHGICHIVLKSGTMQLKNWLSGAGESAAAAAAVRGSESDDSAIYSTIPDRSPTKGSDSTPYSTSDNYLVKFALGNKQSKSKAAQMRKTKMQNYMIDWNEAITLTIDGSCYILEITLSQKSKWDTTIGRAEINIADLSYEHSHPITVKLDDHVTTVSFILSITATGGTNNALDVLPEDINELERVRLREKFSMANAFKDLSTVGQLTVKVFKAKDLPKMDINGKSDPFVQMVLGNCLLQTPTVYKTLNPEWNRIYRFDIKDIHDVLIVKVFDEDKDGVEFIGKLAIPLLQVKNQEKIWYTLKKNNLLSVSSKHPGSILLEMEVQYSHVRAAIRSVLLREEKILENESFYRVETTKGTSIEQLYLKVKWLYFYFRILGKRIGFIRDPIQNAILFYEDCISWESIPRSFCAFLIFLFAVWRFELFMAPLVLLGFIGGNLLTSRVWRSTSIPITSDMEDEDIREVDTEIYEETESSDKKVWAYIYSVVEIMDFMISLVERVKNTFNWSVQYCSLFAATVLFLASVILYLVPLRLIVLLWGLLKFTKKWRLKGRPDSNELLNFLKRVPSDLELQQYLPASSQSLYITNSISRRSQRARPAPASNRS